jgi:hypothetical protein
LKPANRFIAELGIDNENYKHGLGRLILVSRKLEKWMREAFFYLGAIKAEERPYRKANAWEDLLWGPPPSQASGDVVE